MNKPFEYAKSTLVNYKLDSCCGIAPVRIALLFTGYFNILVALMSLVATAEDSFLSIIMEVQTTILEDNATKPIPILAYGAEVAFSAVLLCAIYRNDLVLIRLYMRYCIAAIVTSTLVYSIVIVTIGILVKIAIILSTAYQIYVILLVRSAIVEMKMASKQNRLPIVMSTLTKDKETPADDAPSDDAPPANAISQVEPPANVAGDVESPEPEPETTNEEHKKEVPETKLETVDEHPKT